MNKNLSIVLILGTNRKGRQSENVSKLLMSAMDKHPIITPKLFDVRDFKLPQDDYGPNIKDMFGDYSDAIKNADGVVIVTPEYNHSFPGNLKSVLDMLYSEYKHKPVGIACVSKGMWGGIRAVESLLPTLREFGLVVLSKDLQFPKVEEIFDERGELKDDSYNERVTQFLDELIWMANALKYGRDSS